MSAERNFQQLCEAQILNVVPKDEARDFSANATPLLPEASSLDRSCDIDLDANKATQKGYTRITQQGIENIREAQKGVPETAEARRNMSLAKGGTRIKVYPWARRNFSVQTIQELTDLSTRQVYDAMAKMRASGELPKPTDIQIRESKRRSHLDKPRNKKGKDLSGDQLDKLRFIKLLWENGFLTNNASVHERLKRMHEQSGASVPDDLELGIGEAFLFACEKFREGSGGYLYLFNALGKKINATLFGQELSKEEQFIFESIQGDRHAIQNENSEEDVQIKNGTENEGVLEKDIELDAIIHEDISFDPDSRLQNPLPESDLSIGESEPDKEVGSITDTQDVMGVVEKFLEKDGPGILVAATWIFEATDLECGLEDLFQDTVVELLEHVQNGTFEPINIKSWFWKSLKNNYLDKARRKTRYYKKFKPTTDEEAIFIAPSRELGPEKSAMINETIGEVVDELLHTDETDRIVISGVVNGESYDTIGDEAGMSRGGIKSRVFRFRDRLKESQREWEVAIR